MAINYLNFDLSIEPIDLATGRYQVRVLASPVGEASAEFVLPFSALEIENYILKMGRPRQGVRGLNSSEGRAAQEFGRKLYDAIFQGPVRDCLRSSLNMASQQADQGLRLRLRLNDAPALVDLPWEYLYDTSFRRFFAHSAATPIVRYVDLPERIQPLAVQPPLKILVMIASPRDYGKLDVEAEWRKVQEALADLDQRGLVTLIRLEKATLTTLQRQLRREQHHIFHFIGHGGFDQQTQEGVLLLEDENGLTRLVAGGTLGALLHDHRSLRLAVLNACEAARTAQSDPFAGVAQTLVQQGIPAVIAMQFEITDKAAIIFAHEFYSALADRYPVDAALAEARKAIFAEGNDVEWGTPVLYLRAQDGNIFAVGTGPEPLPPPLPKVEPMPVKPPPSRSIFQGRSYLIGAILILLVLGVWLGSYLPVFQQPDTPTPTLTPMTMATVTTPMPNQTATSATNAAMQTAMAATQTALVPTATLTPTATSTLPPTATANATATPAPTVTQTPAEPAAGATRIIEGITFVYVPAGKFLMGSTPEQIEAAVKVCQQLNKNCDRQRIDNEAPQTSIDVAGFWIMQTEVTNAQYKVFMDDGGYTQEKLWTPAGWKWRTDNKFTQPACWTDDQLNKANYPVVCVSWYETMAYASWLAQKSRVKIGLPTEAQWEKTARGEKGLIYPWSDDWDGSRLNYCDKNCPYDWRDVSIDDGYAQTAPVGSYPKGASPYGALDMAGNVWEWTSTAWGGCDAKSGFAYPYQSDDGRENVADAGCRVVRGGSWPDYQYDVRAAARGLIDPHHRDFNVGLRLVGSPGS